MSENLTDFIEQVTGDSHLRVEEDLGDGFVRLRTAEAERRQARHDIRSSEDIIIEMLRNSRDAHAKAVFVASSREGDARKFTIIDDGDGIPSSMHERIFDARVTSKLDTVHMDLWGVHGRGMALYAVKTNADIARVVTSKVGGGSSFYVETDVNRLGERRDQSSMPSFIISENGVVTVRGPKNINRTVCEFAYIERARCDVYLGSPAEIAATLWGLGRQAVSQSMVAFCRDHGEIDVWKRLALATTPEEFATIAEGIGLGLSTRTARRILDGSIPALEPAMQSIHPTKPGEEATAKDSKEHAKESVDEAQEPHDRGDYLSSILFRDTRGLHVAKKDRDEFLKGITKAYRKLAKSYYLDETIEPKIRYRRDRIDVVIPVIKQE